MRPELVVHGPAWARVVTDAVAVAGVLSLVVAIWWGAVVVALFALVLLGLTVPRVAGVPAQFQALGGAMLLFAAWAATLGWYETVPFLDLLVHAVVNGQLAVLLVVLLLRAGALPAGASRTGTVLVTVGLGALLGVVWEVGEWFGHSVLDDGIVVGYDDTMGDLLAGTVGAGVASLLLARHHGGGDV